MIVRFSETLQCTDANIRYSPKGMSTRKRDSNVQVVTVKVPRSSKALEKHKLRRLAGDIYSLAAACAEFASSPKAYRSIDALVAYRQNNATANEWLPNKGQMLRDMNKIFGADRPSRRGASGRGRGGGKSTEIRLVL